MSENHYISIKRETLWSSIIGDTYSFGVLMAAVSVGYYLDIAALQWVGGFMWIFYVFASAINAANKNKKTISEARQYLDDLETKTQQGT